MKKVAKESGEGRGFRRKDQRIDFLKTNRDNERIDIVDIENRIKVDKLLIPWDIIFREVKRHVRASCEQKTAVPTDRRTPNDYEIRDSSH